MPHITHAIVTPLTPRMTPADLTALAKSRTPMQRAEAERNLQAECRERLNDEAPHDSTSNRIWKIDGWQWTDSHIARNIAKTMGWMV